MSDESRRIGLAIIGCGRWGPNHLRAFSQLPDALVRHVIDPNPESFGNLPNVYPHVEFGAQMDDALSDDRVDAVVIATPPASHAELIHDALSAGKHVLVEKPICTCSREARELADMAQRQGRVLMVGHVFLFHSVFERIIRYVDDSEIGRLQYVHALRTNLGPIRGDVNVLYDLASHDVSTAIRLFDEMPESVSAQGCALLGNPREDVTSLTLNFSGGRSAFIHVSWLDPCKVRRMTVVGDRKMIVWDDTNPIESLRLYDKGVEESPQYQSFGEFHLRLREADVHVPRITQQEPLLRQASAFLDVMRGTGPNLSDGWFGAGVLSILEAAMISQQDRGRCVDVELTGSPAEVIALRDADTMPSPAPIPLVDLKTLHATLREEIRVAVNRVIESGQFILGPDLEQFEDEFAQYCGARHCIGVGSGLDALRLILECYGIGAGDEVITVGNTFIATALAISKAGATPVLIDHDPKTYTIDPRHIAEAITPRTRAIIPVHLYGHPAEMNSILELARAAEIAVIEDAAQAHGAEYGGRRCGSLADAAAFSFYPGKNLGACGDGGAVTTDDDVLAQRLRAMRNYGATQKHLHDLPGCNSRLDNLQAAILRVKLNRLDEWNAERRRIAELYTRELAGTAVVLPTTKSGCLHAHHLYVVRTNHRDEVMHDLTAQGIQAGIHYPTPIHRQPVYQKLSIRTHNLNHTERFANQLLSLPIFPGMTEAQTHRVVRCLKQSIEKLSPSMVA